MNDIVSDILIGLLGFVMVTFMITFVLVMIFGILNIICDVADWFIGRFGK